MKPPTPWGARGGVSRTRNAPATHACDAGAACYRCQVVRVNNGLRWVVTHTTLARRRHRARLS